MNKVLDEVTNEEIDQAHIQRRVDNWAQRLDQLYADIGRWLPRGWSAEPGRPVRMHEELMRKFNVAPRELPTLKLSSQGGDSAYLEPRGLWIIGANGRVDFEHGGERYLLMDIADNFQSPDWQVAYPQDRTKFERLTREWVERVLH